MEIISLSELGSIVRSAIEDNTGQYWVTADIASTNTNRKSGHCYLELVEKSGSVTSAQMRAVIWARNFGRINGMFERGTGGGIRQGIKVLVFGQVSFHEVYGLSFNVLDIEPSYTLGAMYIARMQVIDMLIKEGLIELNRSLPFPPVPQRIAVISSETAAGLGDFRHRIENNPYGYRFDITLYPALMQGEKAEKSIASALSMCRKNCKSHDVIAVIRGGGAQADLECFDSYSISKEAAMMPVPVLAGIGHERDETIMDMVAYKRLITPTAVADFIISKVRAYEELIEGIGRMLAKHANGVLAYMENSLSINSAILMSTTGRRLDAFSHKLDTLRIALSSYAIRQMNEKSGSIETMETKVGLLDPQNVLKRGFSITTRSGKTLHGASELRSGDEILTRFYSGSATSIVCDMEVPDEYKKETVI